MQREGTEGGAVEAKRVGGGAQCCVPSNNVRNEVLLFICFNSLQMCESERKAPAGRVATRITLGAFFFLWGKKKKKTPKTYLRELAQPRVKLVRWTLSCFLFSQLCFGCKVVTPWWLRFARRCFFSRVARWRDLRWFDSCLTKRRSSVKRLRNLASN